MSGDEAVWIAGQWIKEKTTRHLLSVAAPFYILKHVNSLYELRLGNAIVQLIGQSTEIWTLIVPCADNERFNQVTIG